MILEAGENVLVLQISQPDTGACVGKIRAVYEKLRSMNFPGILSLRPGLDCLALELDEDADRHELANWLETEGQELEPLKPEAKLLRVGVCYDEPFSRNLPQVAGWCGISREEVIELHQSRIYDVWMMGFMPGFPYLGPLNRTLQLPRKTLPDPFIPEGSVAIAEEYCGIYPFDSPGGWHIIGRTSVRLIDYRLETPWLLDYGMQVQFYPISTDEFTEQLRQR
ncbi:MAG TPA: 5-oxoprolinase subunit PxpB [Acidobacteriota bacterium]|nr:5-oxoprolinase subunit PxpB [Acidobacteriota bacterium]